MHPNIKKHPQYHNQKKILEQLHLLQPIIFTGHTVYLSQYSSILHRSRDVQQKNYWTDKLQIVMKILKEQQGNEITFMSVVKKCSLLLVIVHESSKKKCSEQMSQIAYSFASQIVKQDIPTITGEKKPPPKRQSSLSKIIKTVRSLSSSQDKYSTKNKMKCQQSSQKGVIKEIMLKIITPLASYLQKITQDFQTYSQIINNHIDQKTITSIKWKVLNNLLSLSKIAVQFSRLGKYYLQELLGPWVMLSYILSKDISIYYHILITYLSKTSLFWKETIAMTLKLSKINKKHKQVQKLLKDQKLLQLKNQIDLIGQVKQNLFYLYYNVHTQQWAHLFEPPFYAGEKVKKMEPIQYILDVFEHHAFQNSVRVAKDSPRKGSRDTQRWNSVEEKNGRSAPKDKIAKMTSLPLGPQPSKEKQEDQTPKTTSTIKSYASVPSRQNNFIQAKKAKAMGL